MNTFRMATLIAITLGITLTSWGQTFPRASYRIIKNEPLSVSLRNKFSTPPTSTSYRRLPSHRTCATDENLQELAARFPKQFGIQKFEAALALAQEARAQRLVMGRQQETVVQIPVVVHVVHNGEEVGSGSNISQAQVASQIRVLNEDFRKTGAGANSHPAGADVEIEFVLALYDPNGVALPEPGINRVDGGRSFWTKTLVETSLKFDTQWDPDRYFNVWTVSFGGVNSDLLGYAQFPSLSDLDGLPRSGGAAGTDGVVCGFNYFGTEGNVVAPYNQGRTMTHEVGHWLGLRHIWGDGNCSVDDFCDDTPLASAPNTSCVPNNSCASSADHDMIENYMDYTPDACMNIFTEDQKARMRTVLEVSPRRKEILQNAGDVIEVTDAPIVAAATNSFSVCRGDSFTLTDNSTNSPTSRSWTITNFADQVIATSTEEVFVFNTQEVPLGDLNLELIVANAAGSDTLTARRVLTVYAEETQTSLLEDLESTDNTDLVNWAVNNPDDDRLWSFSSEGTSAYGVGDWSLMFDNYSDDDDPTGTTDALVSPPLDFSASASPVLTFDYAYARFSEEYSDTLTVFYSKE
ncbi:MAG: M43 family zinc metalloprotease [Bacteroidota bacterium]